MATALKRILRVSLCPLYTVSHVKFDVCRCIRTQWSGEVGGGQRKGILFLFVFGVFVCVLEQ